MVVKRRSHTGFELTIVKASPKDYK